MQSSLSTTEVVDDLARRLAVRRTAAKEGRAAYERLLQAILGESTWFEHSAREESVSHTERAAA